MNAFDGRFALDYIYPLAQTAYDEVWNAAANPVLAPFTQVAEICMDVHSPSFQVAMSAGPSAGSQRLLSTMTKPKGAGALPTSSTVINVTEVTSTKAGPSGPTRISAVSITEEAGIPVDDRFGWVCIDPSCDRLIIAFRGTQTATDWLHDVDFVSEAYRPIEGGGLVHQGFQHVYYSLRDNLLKLIQERCGSIREVLVTGHSLGAALATPALPDIMSFLRGQSGAPSGLTTTLYNLASPRVGHADFKNFYNTQYPCWRIVNHWDLVPDVPPQLASYVHVGAELPIDSGFSLNVAHNHELTTGYLPGLKTWNDKSSKGVSAIASTNGRDVPPGISY